MEAEEVLDLVEDATLDFSLGDEVSAERKLLQACELVPDCLDAWRALAEVRLASGKEVEAKEACERAIELGPEDLTARVSLARILVTMGDKEGAEKATAEARVMGWREELAEDD